MVGGKFCLAATGTLDDPGWPVNAFLAPFIAHRESFAGLNRTLFDANIYI